MHDQTIEERLRSILRRDADALPLTITTDELQRRLALRRRDRAGRRLGLLAAGIAVIAVSGLAIAANLWRGPAVASTPRPSVQASGLPSAAASPGPVTSAEPAPRDGSPLGVVGQAVLVKPIGTNVSRPDSFEVSLLDPVKSTPDIIASIPGSVLPTDGFLDGTERGPVMSRSGLLAIPFSRGPTLEQPTAAIAIVDVRSPKAEPWIIDGYRDPQWGPTEQLAVSRESGSETRVASVTTRSIDPATGELGVVVVSWSADPEARFIATNGDAWGYLAGAGTFAATDDLPAAYQRNGAERTAGIGAHTLAMGCDTSASAGSCVLAERAPSVDQVVRIWYTVTEDANVADQVWSVDGRGVLMLTTSGTDKDPVPFELVFAATPDERSSLGAAELPSLVRPQILGISAEPRAGHPMLVAVGDVRGRIFAFVRDDAVVQMQDGTEWFAGWADDPPPYDPD